jgi:hypothetical protein
MKSARARDGQRTGGSTLTRRQRADGIDRRTIGMPRDRAEFMSWVRTSLLMNSTLLKAGTRTSVVVSPVAVRVTVAAASVGADGLPPQRVSSRPETMSLTARVRVILL